jgi:hypothetical protein
LGHRRILCRQVALAITLCLTASARQIEQPISIVIQPEAEYLGSVKASVTNHWTQQIWFTTCPDPYTEHLMDSQGGIVPYKNPRFPPDQTTECGANGIVTILPGKTWTTEVAINDKFNLKPGTYSLTLQWHFPWNVQNTKQSSSWDTLTVSSNTISVTITH